MSEGKYSARLIMLLQRWYKSNMLAAHCCWNCVCKIQFERAFMFFFFFLSSPLFLVPVFEEHPDISQGVPRQVWPAQQRAV